MIALLSTAQALQPGVIHGIDKFKTGEASAELAKDVLCQPPHVPIGDFEQNAEDRITQWIAQGVRRETPLDLRDETQQPKLTSVLKRHAMSQGSVRRHGARKSCRIFHRKTLLPALKQLKTGRHVRGLILTHRGSRMLETVIVQSPLAFVLVAAESHKVTAAIEVIPGLRTHLVPMASASFGEISGQVFDAGDAGSAVALGHQGKDPEHHRTTGIRAYRRKGQEGAVCIRREETEVSFQVHPFIGEKVP